MAAGQIPAPGTRFGPCKAGCAHRDCQANRKDAEAICRHCGERIGYERTFYREELQLVHAGCAEAAIEEESESRHYPGGNHEPS